MVDNEISEKDNFIENFKFYINEQPLTEGNFAFSRMPQDFYEKIYRLYEQPEPTNIQNRIAFFAEIMRKLIYDLLETYPSRFSFKVHLWQVIGIAKASEDKTIFETSFYRVFAPV